MPEIPLALEMSRSGQTMRNVVFSVIFWQGMDVADHMN
jgi:hypothetical protein